MNHYICLAFEPERVNCGRKSGLGVWRVRDVLPAPATTFCNPVLALPQRGVLRIATARSYRKGTIVNPLRLALDYRRSHAHVHH